MLERISHLPGEILDLQTYFDDFAVNWERIEDIFWKLERGQTFREPGSPNWDAWIAGRWDEAVAITESYRPALIDRHQRNRAKGIASKRLRIVEYPISPYLQWEFVSLKVQVEAGAGMRVLETSKLGDLEAAGSLPEIVILGTQVLYEILYDDTGTLNGARRVQEPDVIQSCRAEMARLYEDAEDLLAFFDREIAHLPPPVPNHV